jgi:signal transduction histidine kinase
VHGARRRHSLAHRLYLKIYLALLASLALFALVVALAWRLADVEPQRRGVELAAQVAQNLLPDADAPRAAQQLALERITRGLTVDLALYDQVGKLIASVGTPLPAPAEEEDRGPRWRDGRHEGPHAWSLRLSDGRWLVARLPWQPRGGIGLVAAALALILLAVALAAYPVVRRLTRRIERLQAGVESLGAGELSARVEVRGHDEVARLAESFNRAAARIEQLVAEQKALLDASRQLFNAASHELRTPLARIRMAAELIPADPQRRADLERDIAELDALIEELLVAARLEAMPAAPTEEEVDLLALAAEEASRYEEAELDGQPVTLRGDPRLLRRLLRNLLENARRHGAPPIELRVSRTAQGAELVVCDRGSGVPEADRERVFEPFYRPATSREASGHGLGLALVRRIAERHGGDARCEPREGGGSCFRVTLSSAAARAA